MEINLSDFPSNYDVSIANNLKPEDADYTIRYARAEPEKGALVWNFPVDESKWVLAKITPTGSEEWIGAFEPGLGGLTAIHSTPSPAVVCVFVLGQGYWTPVGSPNDFEEVCLTPVNNCIPVPDRELLIFVSFTNIAAYGKSGMCWKTPQISWDGIKIDQLTSDKIIGHGWHAPTDKDVEFIVNLADGDCSGDYLKEDWPKH